MMREFPLSRPWQYQAIVKKVIHFPSFLLGAIYLKWPKVCGWAVCLCNPARTFCMRMINQLSFVWSLLKCWSRNQPYSRVLIFVLEAVSRSGTSHCKWYFTVAQKHVVMKCHIWIWRKNDHWKNYAACQSAWYWQHMGCMKEICCTLAQRHQWCKWFFPELP